LSDPFLTVSRKRVAGPELGRGFTVLALGDFILVSTTTISSKRSAAAGVFKASRYLCTGRRHPRWLHRCDRKARAEGGYEDGEEEDRDPAPEASQHGTKSLRVFSYLVQKDTYVQASVWEKVVTLRDNTTFTTHEVSVRKRYKNGGGEWATLHSLRASELYALDHTIRRAEAFILDLRAGDTPF